jgi:hypothetical protein
MRRCSGISCSFCAEGFARQRRASVKSSRDKAALSLRSDVSPPPHTCADVDLCRSTFGAIKFSYDFRERHGFAGQADASELDHRRGLVMFFRTVAQASVGWEALSTEKARSAVPVAP